MSGLQPVPQALFLNSSYSTNNENARPQALFVNVNNLPQPAVTTNQSSNSTNPPPINSTMASAFPAPATVSDSRPTNQNSTSIPAADPPPYPNQVNMPVSQIRIGIKRFQPASEVVFKEEGVLLSLADYNQAPVLLNARAIHSAKIHSKTLPVIFLFLEGSCVKQIKDIFKLSDREFSETSPSQILRCISLFPDTKSLNQNQQMVRIASQILNIFRLMERSYAPNKTIATVVSADEVVSLLMGDVAPNTTTAAATVVATSAPLTAASGRVAVANTSNRMMSPATANTNRSSQDVNATSALQRLNALTNNATLSTPPARLSASHPTLNSINNSPADAMNRSPVQPQGPTMASAPPPPVLRIPTDPVKWQQLQRKLVNGGVYQVLMHDNQKKYCLWNGSKLIPCLVQNTEVQLPVRRARIGATRLEPEDSVQIRCDAKGGVFFKVKDQRGKIISVDIPLSDLEAVHMCMLHVLVVFVSVNIRWTNRFKAMNPQIEYFPTGPDSQRHIMLLLKEVNADQEDALRQMVRADIAATPMITIMPYASALQMLASVKEGTRVRNKILEFERLSDNTANCPSLESIVRDLIASERPGDTEQMDDDDDDVVMTEETVGMKCPYTQAIMENPVRNRICGHNYESKAIFEFIQRKKGIAKCPFAGCGNTAPLDAVDLKENHTLKRYIAQNANKNT